MYTTYDTHGCLTATVVGEGPDTRTATVSYYASSPVQGSIERLTDALGYCVHFVYDQDWVKKKGWDDHGRNGTGMRTQGGASG